MENNLPPSNTEPLPQPTTTPSIDQTTLPRSKKKIFILVGSILVVLIALTGLLYAFFSNPKNTAIKKDTPKEKTESLDIKIYPKFEFTYMPLLEIPGTPPDLYEYTLKDSFTAEDIASLSSHFKLSNPSIDRNVAIIKNTSDASTSGYLVLNTETGEFEYQNAGIAVKITGTDLKASAVQFLADLGLSEAVQCDITYANKQVENTTFVECHRSWETMGAPLLNLAGLINVSEKISFSDLRLGYNSFPLPNPDIVQVSTGQDGIERPNDFNTATFAIRNDGTLLSLKSNLRFIKEKQKVKLISPDEALALFSQNKADTTLALPSGAGSFNWVSVFPKGKTATGNANISGIEISYKDNGPSQKQNTYTPTYIIRGNVELNSGYNVNYVQSISAKKNILTSAQIAESSPKNNLQLETFTLPTKTETVSPTTMKLQPTTKKTSTTPSPTPTTPTLFKCDQSSVAYNYENQLARMVVELSSGEKITVMHVTWSPEANTFWLLHDNLTTEKLNQIRAEFKLIATKGYLKDIPYANYFSLSFQEQYKCYLTGATPSIFIYADNSTEFTITPFHTLYVNPPLVNGSWSVSTASDGIESVNGVKRSYLYYEFNKQLVDFSPQKTGYVIKKTELHKLLTKLSLTMKLNKKESERLVFEFNHALQNISPSKDSIKVSLVSNKELDEKLPLTVFPKPENTNRYHFLLEAVSLEKALPEPVVPAVKRGTSTLVEIGASSVK